MKKYTGIILIALVGMSCGKKAEEKTSGLAPIVFQQAIKDTPDAVVLDVRTLEEVQTERIEGEINFDVKTPEFDILIKGLDKAKPYFVYCASGVRSGRAAEKMKAEGFEKVITLEGGLKAWKEAGLPVQK